MYAVFPFCVITFFPQELPQGNFVCVYALYKLLKKCISALMRIFSRLRHSSTRLKQRSVIRFSVGKRTAQMPATLRCVQCILYGDKCFTRPAVDVLCKKFAYGRESVVDEERPDPVLFRPSTTDTTQRLQLSILS